MPMLEELWRQQADNLVSSVAMSSDGELIAIGSWDKNTYLYKIDGDLVWKNPASDMISSVAMSKDGDLIVTGSWDRYIYAFGKTGKTLWKVKADSYVRNVAVSADGCKIIVGTWSGTFYFLDKEGKILWKDQKPSGIFSVGISDTGKIIALGTMDHQVFVLNDEKEELWREKLGGYISCIAMSHDGEFIVVGSRDSNVYLFDKAGNLMWKYRTGGLVKGLSITIFGDFITAVSHENFIFNLERTGRLAWVSRQEGKLWALASSEFGSLLGIGTKDNYIYLIRNRDAIDAKLAVLQKQIDEARHAKVDVVDAEKELKAAEKAKDEDILSKLLIHIEKATDLLQRSRESFFRRKAEKKVTDLEEAIKGVKDRDIKVLEMMVKRIKELVSESKFDRACRMADKGRNIVDTLPAIVPGAEAPGEDDAPSEDDGIEDKEDGDEKPVEDTKPAERTPEAGPEPKKEHPKQSDQELKNKVSKDIRRLDLILRSKTRAGFDVDEAKELLDSARNTLESGDLEMAAEFVLQAKATADAARKGGPKKETSVKKVETKDPETGTEPEKTDEPVEEPESEVPATVELDENSLSPKGKRIFQAVVKLENKARNAVEGDKETVLDFLGQAREALTGNDEKTALDFLSQAKAMVNQLKMPTVKKPASKTAPNYAHLKCPNCSKRIKPQWTDCPFCRSKLK